MRRRGLVRHVLRHEVRPPGGEEDDHVDRLEGDAAQQLVKLLELLEDMDDVQKVYSNADLDIDSLAEV